MEEEEQFIDVRSWPTTWALPDSISHVPWEDEHQGGGRANAECAEQELVLLRGVDARQNNVSSVGSVLNAL